MGAVRAEGGGVPPPKDPNWQEMLSPTLSPLRLLALLDAPRCCRTPLHLAGIFPPFAPSHWSPRFARAPVSLAFALILGYPTVCLSQFQL